MVKKSTKHLLLLTIIALTFAFRFMLVLWSIYPMGGDVGLHESLVSSILAPKTSILYNYYHMGGEASATNPGYHIFVAFVILLTGAPDYLVQAFVATFFSAFTILSVFLIVRSVFNETAAFIAAFLSSFAIADVEILSWGGYPNIASLMLIPTVFYLYLASHKLSRRTFLIVSSILVGDMFLTHTFSSAIFATVTFCTVFLAALFWKKTGFTRKDIVNWILPIFAGLALVSLYLFNVAKVYFGDQGTISGSISAVKDALVETRLIPITTAILFIVPVAVYFALSKFHLKKTLTVPVLLLTAWIAVPAVMTQANYFGIYLDYDRFLYFLTVPIVIFAALIVYSSSSLICTGLKRVFKAGFARINKTTFLGFILIFLTLVMGIIPSVVPMSTKTDYTFILPNQAFEIAQYYQIMNEPGFEGIQWIKTNTDPNAVFVADANYGWWLSGFGQRKTFSAVEPQYLIVAGEIEPAQMARNLLQTNYLVGNGLIQIRDDGSFTTGFNPEFLFSLKNSYVPYPFLNFNDNGIKLVYRQDGISKYWDFSQVPMVDRKINSDGLNFATIVAVRENQLVRLTEQTSIYRGVRFANYSLTMESKVAGLQFNWVHVPFYASGALLDSQSSIAMVDSSTHMLNQVVLVDGVLNADVLLNQNYDSFELIYRLKDQPSQQIQFFVGSQPYQTTDEAQRNSYLNNLADATTVTFKDKISDQPLVFFDYKKAIEAYNISYYVTRNFKDISRFSTDPDFSLVFMNRDVAIFKIKNLT